MLPNLFDVCDNLYRWALQVRLPNATKAGSLSAYMVVPNRIMIRLVPEPLWASVRNFECRFCSTKVGYGGASAVAALH